MKLIDQYLKDFEAFAASQSSAWLTEPWPGEEGRRARARESAHAHAEALRLLSGRGDSRDAWANFRGPRIDD